MAEYGRTLIVDGLRQSRQAKHRARLLLSWTHVPNAYYVAPER